MYTQAYTHIHIKQQKKVSVNAVVTERLRDLSQADVDSQHPTRQQLRLLLTYSPLVKREKASVYVYLEKVAPHAPLLGAVGVHRKQVCRAA